MKTSAIDSVDMQKTVVIHNINELDGSLIDRHSSLTLIKPTNQPTSQPHVKAGQLAPPAHVDTANSAKPSFVKLSKQETQQSTHLWSELRAYHIAALSQKALPICLFLSGALLTFSWFHL